jgi:hypothetical protein
MEGLNLKDMPCRMPGRHGSTAYHLTSYGPKKNILLKFMNLSDITLHVLGPLVHLIFFISIIHQAMIPECKFQ